MADVPQNRDRDKKIGRFQELFRGRFSIAQAQRLLEHHQWNLQETVSFVLQEEPRRIAEVSQSENERVSKCFRCRKRYDAVPKENEWGIAKGFGQMNNSNNPCYKCGNIVQPDKIFPPTMRRNGERGRHTHSCFAHNCFNRAQGEILPGICVHPRSLPRKVVTPCNPHISSGSTVDTFLTQDDLVSMISGSSRPNLSDIDED
ncbi:shiftless antiviral inhibitor of ribosomal frameshifting protein homolog isoform X4 [Ostrea edulis]|uniref:shiftless antiviral inhibitor of ribosomal frameshifting protein homolog isoform X4 n=1 Tax=Ostrea edulis TaxID=37623 RepID=UPI0024AFA633|nr:shiftless antiviral inhibitor of ribosomal frameshifting protein homolog isoform X4 [Ostrea edulis]